MRVLFRADGSSGKGMGDIHDTCCIADQLSGCDTLFASTNGEPGYESLSRAGRKVIPLVGGCPESEGREMRSILEWHNPSAAVIFVPHGYPDGYYREIGQVSKEKGIVLAGRYTPSARLERYVDIVLGYGDPFDHTTSRLPFHFGPHLIPLPSALKEIRSGQRKRSFEQDRNMNILVFFGGGDFVNATGRVLNALRSAKPDFAFHIVLGEANSNSIDKNCLPANFSLYGAMPQMSFFRLIASCDLAIAAGGTTAFELAYLGVPSLLFAIDEHQPRNIQALTARGASVSMGPIVHLSAQLLLDTIQTLAADKERLQKMSEAGIQAVDGMGAMKIKELILNEVGKRAKA